MHLPRSSSGESTRRRCLGGESGLPDPLGLQGLPGSTGAVEAAGAPSQQSGQSGQERAGGAPGAVNGDGAPNASDTAAAAAACSSESPDRGGARIDDLPLWRVEYAVFPFSQSILHVHKPHYVHMFDRLFSSPQPWVFGHLYLPGGSSNLGAEEYRLESGSQAPLVGVLMEVTRAARLMDGKLLILATATARFKVVEPLCELPYSRAAVELLHDAEELEAANQTALDAAVL
ncbi:hypothetical protein MNEG_13861 [Monoraphidium neglectum]|uniref:Lon N-terminal domain-containing protein n=1 Tax=Monoraphidium neglectum TaxID=145388 RepID=A0A0D2J290_9CHLO|nr:hypothetical protein MNEG_13861 [Monoraphidium neglectum]KIY94102.1 hypothetical protein MNEG_13861 [Monoraphidium neglectum]|eukprot:XP_013893122.1 hypothetical protein MNEG_13861 [Monoraphidium neglectum]